MPSIRWVRKKPGAFGKHKAWYSRAKGANIYFLRQDVMLQKDRHKHTHSLEPPVKMFRFLFFCCKVSNSQSQEFISGGGGAHCRGQHRSMLWLLLILWVVVMLLLLLFLLLAPQSGALRITPLRDFHPIPYPSHPNPIHL